MFEAQLLLPQEQGLTVLKSYLEAHSDAREVRLFYARTLLGQKKLAQSREQFQKVLAADPENSDIAFAIALISMQMGELDVAEDQLKQALRQGNKDEDTMRYYLGQLNEARQHEGEAMDDYRAVKAGEHHFTAQLRLAFLLNKAGKLEEAREVLHQTSPINNVQRVAAVSMEAQFLREAEQFEAAYQVLLKALEKLPNHADLLYEAAMMADRAGRYGEMEKLLRKLIEIKPDNAHAYNALGYSLLERNERLSEAALLVEKALQLEPNDPAIQDSAGWAAYRQGDYDKSVGLLRRAYAVNPDPEIAAHLVEVLWQKGERAEAERLLRDNLKTHPDDKLLLGVKQRLKP
jgi:tetratricopeptide (TPR) repeat protein